MAAGSEVVLFNGDGAEYVARLESVAKTRVEASVIACREANREPWRKVTVACPLPRGDRAQFLIEKLTELGVARYVPLQTSRSVVHPGEGKTEKLRRYVIEASKQCGRNVLMQIEATTDWETLVNRTDLPAERWIAHPGGDALLPASQSSSCIVGLGPEGGWTRMEVELASRHGWRAGSLGKSILRIETAALAAAVLACMDRTAELERFEAQDTRDSLPHGKHLREDQKR